ncbi:MAG: DsbA family protein [Acidobacteriota bacterium]|nr:DsbA family protein [Acidobacteriota bacterium]
MPWKQLQMALLCAALLVTGCRAQAPEAAGSPLSPQLQRRIEVLIRSRSNVPPEYKLIFGTVGPSEMPGYKAVSISFSAEGKTSQPRTFLISDDGKTLAQFTKFDISKDPKDLVSATGRPARGGSASAPVTIVVFDDLECPFCARMHAQLFPAVMDRYKDQVRVVYRDFPLSQHPWAMHAAVDVNCMAAQSTTGYWNLVDFIHLHAAEFGGEEKSLAKANEALDALTHEEGTRQKANLQTLDACVARQDETQIRESMKQGEDLGVDSTPALFINGEKLEGAVPLDDVYGMIDGALQAEGLKAPAAPPAGSTTGPATKPGSSN